MITWAQRDLSVDNAVTSVFIPLWVNQASASHLPNTDTQAKLINMQKNKEASFKPSQKYASRSLQMQGTNSTGWVKDYLLMIMLNEKTYQRRNKEGGKT